MEVPPIFEINRIHCFYKTVNDLSLSKIGTVTYKIPISKLFNKDVCIGESKIYDTLINNYDKSINFEKLRNEWVKGKTIPTENILVSIPEPEPEPKPKQEKKPLRPTATKIISDDIIDESIELNKPTGSVNEDNIFDHLALLQWRDKDELKMSISQLNKIPINILNEMFPIMQTLAANFQTALANQTGAIESMEPDDRNNFLFHVIAKGREIYYQSLCDADFCLYMIDNWQPLYTFMCKKLKRTN